MRIIQILCLDKYLNQDKLNVMKNHFLSPPCIWKVVFLKQDRGRLSLCSSSGPADRSRPSWREHGTEAGKHQRRLSGFCQKESTAVRMVGEVCRKSMLAFIVTKFLIKIFSLWIYCWNHRPIRAYLFELHVPYKLRLFLHNSELKHKSV